MWLHDLLDVLSVLPGTGLHPRTQAWTARCRSHDLDRHTSTAQTSARTPDRLSDQYHPISSDIHSMLFVKDTEEQKHGEEDMCVKNREKGRQL